MEKVSFSGARIGLSQCQDDPSTLETMEELLLPSGKEETCSDQSYFAPGATVRTLGNRVKDYFMDRIRRVWWRNWRDFCRRNGLLTLSVIAVITGCTLGFLLRGTQLSTQAKIYFSFPGELLMRMLKMLILPLITSSLMSGLSSMESKACCRMGVLTVTYYLWTTFIAVVVGIVLVLIIKPGTGTEMDSNRLGGGPVMTSADALLDLIRNMVPSNLIEATFQQYKTDLIPILKVPARTIQPNFVYVVPDDSDPKGRTVYLELTPPPDVIYKTSPGSSQQMNVLGIVIFSATMGLLLGRMGERGAPLVNVCQCINECVMKIINAAVWYFPFGIIFLVAGKILDMQDPSTLGKKLGWKNPFSYIRGLLQAMVIALATSSSSATLPITMKCLLENCHVDRQIARFVLPVGATINMDGTALYEAVAAIFIAQVNDYELDFGQLVTISITATAASIGAAGIPQAGLVTMVIVLTSVGLPPDDITLIVAIDWILDRFRTMINVLGDALAAGIIAHLCRKDFPLNETGKSVPSYGTQNPHSNSYSINVPMTEIHTHKDCIFETTGDCIGPRQAHTVYYNICQV
ncbi:Excitatory amino acid transporter 5 [Crenichthys baileyi]|uniref:Amino acid transporter n=1 Tax=Crenichthys baileyi TaxID=28760 RepID=A0AAV9RY91_9TELE